MMSGKLRNCTLVQLVYMDGHLLPRAERMQFFVLPTSSISCEVERWLRALDGRCVDRGREMGRARVAWFDALHEWLHALAQGGGRGGAVAHVTGPALGEAALAGVALTRVVTIGMLADGEADASPDDDGDEDDDEGGLAQAMEGLNVSV